MIESMMNTGYGRECAALEGKNLMTARLLQMIRENPDLPVVPMVSQDVVPDNDYSWYVGEFGMCSIDSYCCDDERMWLKVDDEDEMLDKWADDHEEELEGMTTKEAEVYINKHGTEWIESLPWIRAIIVWIEA